MHIKIFQDVIDIIRRKKNITHNKIVGKNNINIPKNLKKKIKLNIVGENNTIVISENNNILGVVNINIYGNNNQVVLGENVSIILGLNISIGNNHVFHGEVENVNVSIGENTRIEDANITTFNSNNSISIGKNCLISLKVNFYNTGGHPIYDKVSEKITNIVKNMKIGDSCWIGYNATILKGVSLPNNTIVGWGSVVSKSITKEFCALAGNPAKIIKENVIWKSGDKNYVQNKW